MLKRGDFTIIHLHQNGQVQVDGRMYEWKKFVQFLDENPYRAAWIELQGQTFGVEWTADDAVKWPALYSRLDVLLYRMAIVDAPFLQIRIWYDPFKTTSHTWDASQVLIDQIKQNGQVLQAQQFTRPGDAILVESEDLINARSDFEP